MDKEKTVRKRRRWPWILAVVVVALPVALVLLLPTILVSISYPTIRLDLAPYLDGPLAGLASNKTAVVDFSVVRGNEGSFVVRAYGTVLDWPFSARADVTPKLRLLGIDAKGYASFSLDDAPWQIAATFEASSSGDWHMDATMDETALSDRDPILSQILARLSMPAISNLAFNGTISLSAKAERTAAVPVPKWNARCRLENVRISCSANDTPLAIDNLRMSVNAIGIANHTDIHPIHPFIGSVTAAGFVLSNAYAHVQATDMTVSNTTRRTYLVSEAGAKCCGGDVRVYSLYLDPDRLNAGVTLFLDGIDTGLALKHFSGFHGEASGRLYGKLPLRMRRGEHLKLGNTYLYSVPGETGNLKVFDPKPIVDNLAMGGVPQATCDNLSNALTDLDYDVLKISLAPDSDGGLALTLKIAGKATRSGVTVPVSLEVTFHGDLEQLLNTGFRTINMK